MRYRLLIVLLGCLMAAPAWAQKDKDERKDDRREVRQEKDAATRNRVDYNVFRRQILALPEFDEQRKKLSDIKKRTGSIPKLFAVVDSLNDADDSKVLMGYITMVLGDNTANIYVVTYDRNQKKIVLVKPTGETLEADKPEVIERKDKNAKPPAKKKKTGDDDEEDNEEPESEDEPEEKPEKPAKRRQTDEDD